MHAGAPLRYRIGADDAPAIAGCVVEAPYGVGPPPGGIWYCNLYDEIGTFGPYLADTDTSKQYGEHVVDPAGAGFPRLISGQLAAAKPGDIVEWDNIDGHPLDAVLQAYEAARSRGVFVAVKNPGTLKDGGGLKLVAHPCAALIIVEKDCGSPDEMASLRIAAGRPDLPVRFVAFGDGRAWAENMAASIRAKGYADMGVTYDAAPQEYGGAIEDIQLPIISKVAAMPTVTGAQIVAKLRECLGKFHDGPDVPAMAREVGQIFPDLAQYSAEATNAMPWCADFEGWFYAHYFGIAPPPVKDGVGYFWVDRWKDIGTPVPPAQKQLGDICMWFGAPHHISNYVGNGKYIGGNQSDAVTEAAFREPDAVRRPPNVGGVIAMPPIATDDLSQYPLLTAGDTGPFVTQLQQLLGTIDADGEFGASTEAAVRAFQAAHPSLQADGEVGPQTWAALLGKPVPISAEPARYLQYRAEYAADWARMTVDADRASAVESIARKLLANKPRYQAAATRTGVPWFVIAALHQRESSADFSTQLAQGDPLNSVSHNVPAGRGPFASWEDGAYDALVTLKALNTVSSWPIERIAYECERYNGWGYRSQGVPSAYLWSFSNIYQGGKYIADHVWSSTARDAQCGTLPLVKRMAALDSTIMFRDPAVVVQPAPPPAPTIPLPPSDPVIPHIIARIDKIAAELAALRAQQEPKPMADPAPTATAAAPAAPQLDVSSIIDKAVKAAMTAQQVSSSPTWAALKAAIPGGSVYLSIAAFVALWVVQSHGLVGTGMPGAATATPTGGTLTALLSGGGIAGLFASFRQLLTPKAKA